MQKEFIGKQALLKQMKEGVRRRFVQLLVDEHDMEKDTWPQGGEAIYRNGKHVGWTTSAAYGFTLGCQVIPTSKSHKLATVMWVFRFAWAT